MHQLRLRFGLAGLALVTALVGAAVVVAVRSYLREAQEFFPARHALDTSAAAVGVEGLSTITFRDRDGASLHGWYVPSTNRAGVLLIHGAGGDRASLLAELRQLASNGFGVLTFDLPGQGESDGQIHWSEGEARALVAAIDFLAQRPDVDASRLGALGFSLGGAVLARVAPDEPRLRAVVFDGTPSDQFKQIMWETRQFGPLTQYPALWAVLRGGVPVYTDQPVQRVGEISPRAVLIVNGTDDQTVPVFLARDLFAAAREPKELMLIEGGGHGNLERAPSSPYLNRLSGFFTVALLDETR